MTVFFIIVFIWLTLTAYICSDTFYIFVSRLIGRNVVYFEDNIGEGFYSTVTITPFGKSVAYRYARTRHGHIQVYDDGTAYYYGTKLNWIKVDKLFRKKK